MNIKEITQKHGPGYYWVKYKNPHAILLGWDLHLKKYDEMVEILYNSKGYNTTIFEFNDAPNWHTRHDGKPRPYTIFEVGHGTLNTQDTFLEGFEIVDYKFLDCELWSDTDDGSLKVPFKNVEAEYEKLKKKHDLPAQLFVKDGKMNMPTNVDSKQPAAKKSVAKTKKAKEDDSVKGMLKEMGLDI